MPTVGGRMTNNAPASALLLTGGIEVNWVDSDPSTACHQPRRLPSPLRDEDKQDDPRRWPKDLRVRFHVDEVREPESLADVMSGVEQIFHTAALKQVPSSESFPLQVVPTYRAETKPSAPPAIAGWSRWLVRAWSMCRGAPRTRTPGRASGRSPILSRAPR